MAGFFERLFNQKPEVKPEELVVNTSVETKREQVAEKSLPDYLVNKMGGRVILYIPKIKFKAVGGRDAMWQIFRDICNGSNPVWAEEFEDSYAVEITANPRSGGGGTDEEIISALKNKIDSATSSK